MKSNIMRRSTLVASIAALLMAMGAADAMAAPRDCTVGGGPSGSWAVCNSGTGYYRAWLLCQNDWWPFGATIEYGPWRSIYSGQMSHAKCGWHHSGKSWGVDRRN